jgi:transposase
MKVVISKSKNSTSLYIAKSFRQNGKSTSKMIESLGTLEEIQKKSNGQDPLEWAKERAKELTLKEKLENQNTDVMVKYSPSRQIKSGEQHSVNGGYLFLQALYYQLGLHKIAANISKKYKFEYDFNAILSQLIYSRILCPGSKRMAFQAMKNYIETPTVDLHDFYRALEIIYKEQDYIQSELYNNSKSVVERNSKILYYDCSNFYFEIEQEDGIRQYGKSKENRPNPIVQMGLFMDGNGIPLAFDITPGNTNEQTTLKPLEQKILKDFDLSKVVVCTDAGLSSAANRQYNNVGGRAFITTQSIKKLKLHLKEWSLNDEGGWYSTIPNGIGKQNKFTIAEIDELNDSSLTFYKERWINENGLEQRLIVTYSLKYKHYQEKIRQRQIDRAIKLIDSNQDLPKKINQHDYKRLIKSNYVTQDGELADKAVNSLDQEVIDKEAMFDGFSAVCTNLEDDVKSIIKMMQGRWEIEETFRIMKSSFEARPIHLSRDERITAHFTTCFLSMVIFRVLEKKLGENFTHENIIETIRNMNFQTVRGTGLIPTYTRTDLTDALHDAFGFRTDLEIITNQKLKEILKSSKS